jgi:two-component system, NtrC family, sensor kinase
MYAPDTRCLAAMLLIPSFVSVVSLGGNSMRVALKFVLTMIFVLVSIRLIEGVLTIQHETSRLDAAIERDSLLLGRILKTSVGEAWRANGRQRALDLIDAMDVRRHPITITWAPWNGKNGLETRLDPDSLLKLRNGRMVSLRRHDAHDGQVQHSFVPIGIPGADGVIELIEALAERSRYVRHALDRQVLAGGAVVFLNGVVIILLGIVVIGRPLSLLRERIHGIGEGDLSSRIALQGHDDFATLADGLNAMCERLSASRQREREEIEKRIAAMEQVRHMDRLTTIGRLASGMAHELGTPLNVIGGRAEMIADDSAQPDSQRIRKNAATIKSQADRMTQIIRHLLDFARQRPPKRVRISAVDVVAQAVELVSCLGYKAVVHLEAAAEHSRLLAEMDPVQMQQVMTNLIENALQAMPDGGQAKVTLDSVVTQPPPGLKAPRSRYLQITVHDEGAGISHDDLASIFDPFFTTKDVGQGTGLGLSIAYGIVREHAGWIDVASTPGQGSRFTVYIPQEDV